MNNTLDIDKAYVSPYDKFLAKFDATHEKTASQLREIQKNQRIAILRDYRVEEKESIIWEDF